MTYHKPGCLHHDIETGLYNADYSPSPCNCGSDPSTARANTSADSLVKQLRSCAPEEREASAFALAATHHPRAVAELIRMAEGKRRRWFSSYTTDEQSVAVEALAATRLRSALDYLCLVYGTTKVSQSSETEVQSFGNSDPRDDDVYTTTTAKVRYPRVRKGLSDLLSYEKVCSVEEEFHGETCEDTRREYSEEELAASSRPHAAFQQAIRTLRESDLGSG